MTDARIVVVEAGDQLETVRRLLREYAEATGLCSCFQNLGDEIAGLPGEYAPPEGRLLLAQIAGQPGGCVALRRIGKYTCEMKRLYVRPLFRGRKLGRQLAEASIAIARQIGYRTMRLDTLDSMSVARSLYRRLGFQNIPPYNSNQDERVLCLELNLA